MHQPTNTFNRNIIPANETERLKALESFKIVDTAPEGFFNNLASIIARTFDTPIALVSFVKSDEVFFKANVGMEGTTHVPRGISLCSLAILEPEPTIFENAPEEPCLLSNPLVAGEFGLKFYAGAPIITPDGYHIGTVCVVDKKPREFAEKDEELLVKFSQTIMNALLERKENLELLKVEA
jgi:GAF domain-containing protein